MWHILTHLTFIENPCRSMSSQDRSRQWWNVGRWFLPVSQRGAPVEIEKRGGPVTITQDYDVTGLGGLIRYTPRFNLALGKTKPYALAIEAGASDVAVDLGGVPVKELAIKQAAGMA